MDVISKKEILGFESLSQQRTQLFAIKLSVHIIRKSNPPLRGWVCHFCAHFNAPGTLASPEGPCQTCTLPVCDALCADATVTTRADPRCAGYACWYCKYFWVWPRYDDGDRVSDNALSCTVCGNLEEGEVVFVKSWFEELDRVEEEVGEQQEEKKEIDGNEKGKVKIDDFDDGQGAFIIVDRKRAKPKKKYAGGGGATQ